jgi:hypothetical protein
VAKIQLGDIAVEVVQKSIKNIHLSVYPPQGKVRIAAPLRMDLGTNILTVKATTCGASVTCLKWLKMMLRQALCLNTARWCYPFALGQMTTKSNQC